MRRLRDPPAIARLDNMREYREYLRELLTLLTRIPVLGSTIQSRGGRGTRTASYPLSRGGGVGA